MGIHPPLVWHQRRDRWPIPCPYPYPHPYPYEYGTCEETDDPCRAKPEHYKRREPDALEHENDRGGGGEWGGSIAGLGFGVRVWYGGMRRLVGGVLVRGGSRLSCVWVRATAGEQRW